MEDKQYSLFVWYFPALLFIEGSQNRNPNSISLEVGADAEAVEKHCLLAYCLPVVCSACFLIKPRTPSPQMFYLEGPGPTMGRAFPHQSNSLVQYVYMYVWWHIQGQENDLIMTCNQVLCRESSLILEWVLVFECICISKKLSTSNDNPDQAIFHLIVKPSAKTSFWSVILVLEQHLPFSYVIFALLCSSQFYFFSVRVKWTTWDFDGTLLITK